MQGSQTPRTLADLTLTGQIAPQSFTLGSIMGLVNPNAKKWLYYVIVLLVTHGKLFGQTTEADIPALVSNLLTSPVCISEYIFSSSRIQKSKPGDKHPKYLTNHFRAGVYGTNFYVFQFSSADQVSNTQNAVTANGQNGEVSWRYSGSFIIFHTNKPNEKAESDWLAVASGPLKLGVDALKLGSVRFSSPLEFQADSFDGRKLFGSISVSDSNQCDVSWFVDGFPDVVRTATLIWLPNEGTPGLPQRIIRRMGNTISSETTIHSVAYVTDKAFVPEFLPGKLPNCHLRAYGYGSETGTNVTLYDPKGRKLEGRLAPRPIAKHPPKRKYILVSIFAAVCLPLCAWTAVVWRRRKENQRRVSKNIKR